MQVDEGEEKEKGTPIGRATFLKDVGVIHLKLPCSLSIMLMLILASKMLCFSMSHFVFLVLLENRIVRLHVIFNHKKTNVFHLLCLNVQLLVACFYILAQRIQDMKKKC